MLAIETFDQRAGGNVIYKALAHPLAAEGVALLYAELEKADPVALYDPDRLAGPLLAMYPRPPGLASLFVHDVTAVGGELAGLAAQPLTALSRSGARTVLIAAFGLGIYLRTHVVPPDCADPATVALVRQSLLNHFKLPASVTITDIETHSCGYFAFRFACEASLGGIDPRDLPPGTPIPGSVYYVSRLTDGGKDHEVSVRIYPLLKLEKVQ